MDLTRRDLLRSGAALAGAVLLVITGGHPAFAGELAGTAVLGLEDAAILAVLPLAGTALATLVARLAVLHSLQRIL